MSVRTEHGLAVVILFAMALPAVGHADDRTQGRGSVEQPQVIGAHGVRLINPAIYVADPPSGELTPQRQPDIDQDRLLAGDYPLYQVLEAGQNLFNKPFEPEHGHGEGRRGPRSLQRSFWNPRASTFDQDAWPFLRVNGIDSQSCFECHNTIGEYVPSGARTVAQVRKPGAQGGPAGAANSAFINDQFPEYMGQANSVMTKFVRNPPPVFGTGYTQRLATEMTTELKAQAMSARVAGTRTPRVEQSINLISKEVAFGTFATVCADGDLDSCRDDTTRVNGVQGDLIVRPFQWGGISSSVRHFARDALDFHFSVQAVEKVGHKDCDLDGLIDEVTVGNVTALASYVAMFRPPSQVVEAGKEASVARGRELMDRVGCTHCHRASMPIDKAILTVMTPPPVPPDAPCPDEVSSLINPVASGEHDIERESAHYIRASLAKAALTELAEEVTPQQVYDAIKGHLHDAMASGLAETNYQIDLSLTGLARDQAPAYVWPRLPADAANAVQVPLFSDLKLHYMGRKLSDDYPQPTDVQGYSAKPGHYVTRVLWGIGDSDPYLHDGRARTLRDAIGLHGAEGSDAAQAAASFAALPADDQQALIDFLQSLRLPIAEGVTQPQYVAN